MLFARVSAQIAHRDLYIFQIDVFRRPDQSFTIHACEGVRSVQGDEGMSGASLIFQTLRDGVLVHERDDSVRGEARSRAKGVEA